MTKDVLVAIDGLELNKENDESIETNVKARYYMKNGTHYILYEELIEEYDEEVECVLKFREGYLEVIRREPASIHMIFEEDRKNVSTYHTPYGSFLMGIDAGKIRVKEKEDIILVNANYALEINYEYVADRMISICVTSSFSEEG